MASKRSKKKQSKSPVWWHWAIVAAGAFLLYQGLQYYLNPEKPAPSKKPIVVKTKSKAETPPPEAHHPTPAPTPHLASGPEKFSFQSAARFLPQEAYPDNYIALPLEEANSGLLAYAKTIPGRKPGPQGLTNTQPGLRSIVWNGKGYDTQEVDFEALKVIVGNVHFVGPPQLERRPWISGAEKVFPAKLFLTDEDRLVVAYLLVDAKGARVASVLREDGKEEPAAFLQGTTAAVTRKVSKTEHGGKNYIVVEKGSLDVAKPEAGYQWKVEAYAWNGKSFVYDKDYSTTLTKAKKSSEL